MRKLVLVLIGLCLAAPASASAAKWKTLKSSGTITGHFAEAPAADGSYRFAGIVDDSRYGKGAIVTIGRLSGTTTSGTFRAYSDIGSVRGTFSFTVTPNADGSLTGSGTTKIKDATGRYRRAKGSGSVTFKQDAAGYAVFSYTQKYKVR